MASVRNLMTAKIYDIKAHSGIVTSLELGETGRVLVTGGQDRNVNLWAIGQKECFMSLTGHNRPIECVRFAYNDDFVYSADDIGIIRRWDLNAESIYSTLNGHMKSVRTLDFDASGEYVVSGSNDTTVRLWDVQNQNKCIKIYRGHMSHVNSVKFSPDGLWIASAGAEGSVIIWDIRKSKNIMDFTDKETAAPVTCIQFHPFEFLLAIGCIDGTIRIVDLENETCILQTDTSSRFYGQAIKSMSFSENGECLFVGTTAGISVIGWEPNQEFDFIKSSWTNLGDMKVAKAKLILGCYENDSVSVNALNVDEIMPFYNPTNAQQNFNYNTTNRKSFTRGKQNLRVSIGNLRSVRSVEEAEEYSSSSNNSTIFMEPMSPMSEVPVHDFAIDESISESAAHPRLVAPSTQLYDLSTLSLDYNFEAVGNAMDYNPNDVTPPVITNYDNTEMAEDFPVNQNLQNDLTTTAATVSNVVASSMTTTSSTSVMSKLAKKQATTATTTQKRSAYQNTIRHTSSNLGMNKLSSQVTSMSSMELNKLDENLLLKKCPSTHTAMKQTKRSIGTQFQVNNKENTKNQNISITMLGNHQNQHQPPTRSRTSIDMRSRQQMMKTTENHASMNYRPDLIPMTGRNINRNTFDEDYDIQVLTASHELLLQKLSNRQASLQMLRNLTSRQHDVVGAFRQAVKINDRSIFVDLLGAILEKPSSWNLDLCIFMLPEIYELLQSKHKFHFTRACDTLRIIIMNFLPIIQENLDPCAANGLGVDVTREDRQRKCLECQRWLLLIRNLPESNQFGTNTLLNLQNMITI